MHESVIWAESLIELGFVPWINPFAPLRLSSPCVWAGFCPAYRELGVYLRMLGVSQNELLAPFTTLEVGGHCKAFVRVNNHVELREALGWASEETLEVYILGGGSNLLVADSGVSGCVMQMAMTGIEITSEDSEQVTVQVAAGEVWDGFVAHAIERSWAGLECMSGIPGWVGAAPIQNIGAYGQEVASTIKSVEVMDVESGEVETFTNTACDFSYRNSIFKKKYLGKKAVMSVTFCLKKKNLGQVTYKDLIQFFEKNPQEQTLAAVRAAVLDVRAAKSMLLNKKDPNSKSAGSFFTNPILSASQAALLKEKAAGKPPLYVYGQEYKTSAAWLIEKTGFQRGYQYGAAALSSNHTLALINPGQAKAKDIVALALKLQQAVFEKWDIRLIPEPQFWGFEKHPLL